jgi:hypothetical protein
VTAGCSDKFKTKDWPPGMRIKDGTYVNVAVLTKSIDISLAVGGHTDIAATQTAVSVCFKPNDYRVWCVRRQVLRQIRRKEDM